MGLGQRLLDTGRAVERLGLRPAAERLADADGGQIQSLGFKGATTLPTAPLAWTIAANPPGQTGDPALYSGSGTDRDEAAVTPITVPAGSSSLTFNALWDLELGWDFAFVQISTDGGAT